MARNSFPEDFKTYLAERKPIVGTFIKNSAPEQVEVLGLSGLDFAVLDTEHAAFDRQSLASCLLAAKAERIPMLVRTPSLDSAAILQALDMGATGVLVPHVRNRADAEKLALISHYGPSGRGFAVTTRSGNYGLSSISNHLEHTAKTVVVIGQIEDVEALDELDDLFDVKGIDAYLIGRVDLTVALGESSPQSPIVEEAVDRICARARQSEKALGMFISDLSEASRWVAKGVSFFLTASDHVFVFKGAVDLQKDFSTVINSSIKETRE
jgi:2-keto-3-deoxy-L-rhamnonate aldolase RhmA